MMRVHQQIGIFSLVALLLLIVNIPQFTALTISTPSFQSGRNLIETRNVLSQDGIRQEDNTVRVDPLKRLKKYRGGYDITNKHYWSSTAFTGIPGYALAVVWLLFGIVCGVFFIVATTCCCSTARNLKKKQRLTSSSYHHQRSYLLNILLATFFTILAIIASGLVLGGNAKFHSRAKTVVRIIIDTADEASETIYNTTGAMKDMSNNLEDTNAADGREASRFLSSTSLRLDSRAADIQKQATRNRRAINKGLEILYIVSSVIISINLLVVITLSVLGLLKFRRALHLFIVFCWLLTVLCWVFFGAYFFIGKFAGDTCTALEDFQIDPYNNSLSEILPCDQLLSAKSVLSDVSAGVFNLVNEVNTNISYMQGSPFHICNPFSPPPQYNYEPNNCSDDAVRIEDIPQLLRLITCIDPENGVCNGGIPISGQDFRTVEAYSRSIETLLNAYPSMERLVECQTVKDTFSTILDKHCKPLKRDVHLVWASLVFLSTTMVVLLLTWVIRAYHDQKHDHFSDGSVKPHTAATASCEYSENSTIEDIEKN